MNRTTRRALSSFLIHPSSLRPHPSCLLPERLPARRDRVELGLGALDDLRRERRVRVLRVFRRGLAVVDAPPEEINEHLALGRVLLVFVDEDVGVTGNRISARA